VALSDTTLGSTLNGSIAASVLNNSDEGIDDGNVQSSNYLIMLTVDCLIYVCLLFLMCL